MRRRSRWRRLLFSTAALGAGDARAAEDHRRASAAAGRGAAAGRPLHDERLLPRFRRLGGSALHALQHAAAHRRDVGRQLRRRMGRLQSRASVQRVDEPVSRTRRPRSTTTRCSRRRGRTADRRATIAATRRRTGTATTTLARCSRSSGASATTCKPATLMQVLTPEYRRRFAQALYHVAVTQLRAMGVVDLLPGRDDPLVGAGHSQHPGHGDASPGAAPVGHRAQHSSPDPHRPEARDARSRSGTGRRSASGTARRSSRGRTTCKAGGCRTRCPSSAASSRRSRSSRATTAQHPPRDHAVRPRGVRRSAAPRGDLHLSRRTGRPRCATSGRSVSRPLERQRPAPAGGARHRHRIPRSRLVRPALGEDLGGIFRRRHDSGPRPTRASSTSNSPLLGPSRGDPAIRRALAQRSNNVGTLADPARSFDHNPIVRPTGNRQPTDRS